MLERGAISPFVHEVIWPERFPKGSSIWLRPLEGFVPRSNLVERDEEFEVTVDLPGMKLEDFHVEMRDGHLFISGEKEEEKENESPLECVHSAGREKSRPALLGESQSLVSRKPRSNRLQPTNSRGSRRS